MKYFFIITSLLLNQSVYAVLRASFSCNPYVSVGLSSETTYGNWTVKSAPPVNAPRTSCGLTTSQIYCNFDSKALKVVLRHPKSPAEHQKCIKSGNKFECTSEHDKKTVISCPLNVSIAVTRGSHGIYNGDVHSRYVITAFDLDDPAWAGRSIGIIGVSSSDESTQEFLCTYTQNTSYLPSTLRQTLSIPGMTCSLPAMSLTTCSTACTIP